MHNTYMLTNIQGCDRAMPQDIGFVFCRCRFFCWHFKACLVHYDSSFNTVCPDAFKQCSALAQYKLLLTCK